VEIIFYAIGVLILMNLIAKELLCEGHSDVEYHENNRENYSQCSTAKGSSIAAKTFITIDGFHGEAMDEIKQDFAVEDRHKAHELAEKLIDWRIFVCFVEDKICDY